MTDDALAKIRSARLKRDQWNETFRRAIYRASAEGHSLRTIAREAGISHVRVLQILREQ